MLRNYFKVALRILSRNKAFSLINISGLAIGMASALFISLWVIDELSVDSFHENKDQLYAVYSRRFNEGRVEAGYVAPGPLAEELKAVIPEVEYAAGFDPNNISSTFEVNTKTLQLSGTYAGEDFFRMFSYPLLGGSAEKALMDIDGIAISRNMAEIFFGSPGAAIGKLIHYENRKDLLVTAVFENLPYQASEKFEFLLSWKMLLKDIDWLNSWVYNRPRTYIMLRAGADPRLVETKLTKFLDGYNQQQTANLYSELGLQRFDRKYLYNVFKDGHPADGRIEYVKLFGLVAIFILLIACINFMNLSTARSVKRAKEVGVRKVVGAGRSFLIAQFSGEAILLTFYAMFVSIMLVTAGLPSFNSITNKNIVMPFGALWFWLALGGLTLVIGLISGSYPAIFLSSLNPIRILKGKLKFAGGDVVLRKSLVVFQFIISIVMIAATIMVSRQINFIQNKNLGFDKENLVYIPFQGELASKYQAFKDETMKLSGVKNVTRMSRPPEMIIDHGYDLDWSGRSPDARAVVIHVRVGYDYSSTMNLQLLQGHDFTPGGDTTGYMINETAAGRLGFKDPIGQQLSLFGRSGKVIGVLKDFHFNSLRTPIEPLVVFFAENISWGFALVRIQPENPTETLAGIEKICRQLNPGFPFSYHFTDQEYQHLYNNEQMVGKLSSGFAFIAIFICCLGLLGLVMFAAEQKTREIGIRKVLGASTLDILGLLSKDLMRLVGLSTVLAVPLAWWSISSWLENFAYRAEITWNVFAMAGFSVLLIALATISFHTTKAALMNPVQSLRSE